MINLGLLEPMSLKREQLKAARAILGLTGRQVAELAGVASNTISRFENGHDAYSETLDKIQSALEKEGIEFPDTTTIRYLKFIERGKITPE